MVALDITETSKSLAVAGGYVTVIGLVSYLVKEKLFVCTCDLLSQFVRFLTSKQPKHCSLWPPVSFSAPYH